MSVLGVWMWPQSIELHGAKAVISRCARTGVTDIYFLTKGLSGKTSYSGSIAPAFCERDLLRELLDEAHRYNIRVHAWLTSASDEHYKNRHPQSGRCHFTRGKDRPLISLTDSGYLGYMEQVTAEICREYDVDGLHLDYIRYNHLLYGWSDEDWARYAAEGADPSRLRALMEQTFFSDSPHDNYRIFEAFTQGDESAHALARVRRRDVVHFAQTLIKAARAEKSKLTISAALMPEGAYDDIAFSDLHYGQNYEDAANLYDCVLPMAYSKAYEKDADWVRMVAEGTLSRGLRTVMGLHAYDGGTGMTLTKDIASLKDTAIDGICLFREGAFATAFKQDSHLHLINTLSQPITSISLNDHASQITLSSPLLPEQEQILTIPEHPECLRVFSGETEVCVYLSQSS